MGELDNLTWEGNSKKMYEACLEAVPKMFRGSVTDKVEDYVEDNEVTVITEELIVTAIGEQAPASFKDKFLKILEPLKTK